MNQKTDWKAVAAVGVGIVLLVVCVFGLIAGIKSFSRYQKRADANNSVKVTHINIRKASQQAQVVRAQIAATKAKAEMRFQESIGIKRAQDEISKTLTPLYVQHEAIQAQERTANSKNHTQTYIPSGAQGIPIVKTAP